MATKTLARVTQFSVYPATLTGFVDPVLVAYRDGVVRVVDRGLRVIAEASVYEITRVARRAYDLTLVDGRVWFVRPQGRCGCGDARKRMSVSQVFAL